MKYSKQGCDKKLMETFKGTNKNAWKCEIFSNLKNGQKLEYGIGMNESNFSTKMIRDFIINYLIQNEKYIK